VPWLLLNQNDSMRHVGTLDVDLTLDAAALGDGEYAHLVESLKSHGYEQRESLRRFQLVRQMRNQAFLGHTGGEVDQLEEVVWARASAVSRRVPAYADRPGRRTCLRAARQRNRSA
jgi:hypothetical protein